MAIISNCRQMKVSGACEQCMLVCDRNPSKRLYERASEIFFSRECTYSEALEQARKELEC